MHTYSLDIMDLMYRKGDANSINTVINDTFSLTMWYVCARVMGLYNYQKCCLVGSRAQAVVEHES